MPPDQVCCGVALDSEGKGVAPPLGVVVYLRRVWSDECPEFFDGVSCGEVVVESGFAVAGFR
jgi:hypothetical protein